jgi:hypothetical protein
MAALAADSPYRYKGSPTKHVFSGNVADIHYGGALLFIDTGGGVQAVPAAGDYFAGIVTVKQTVVNAGDPVEAFIDGLFFFPLGTNIAAADEGDLAIIDISGTLSDNPTDLVSNLDATGAVGDIVIGRIYQVLADGMWVKLEPRLCVTNVGWV